MFVGFFCSPTPPYEAPRLRGTKTKTQSKTAVRGSARSVLDVRPSKGGRPPSRLPPNRFDDSTDSQHKRGDLYGRRWVREGDEADREIGGYLECGWPGSALCDNEGRHLPLAAFVFSPPVMLPRSLFRGRSDKYSRRS